MISDLRHIRAFIAAARIGNFTRAAAELHLSQSAFTVQIRQLEDALGVILFDRSNRRVSLTPAGREVQPSLERLLLDAEAIVSQTRDLAGLRRGMVSIAVLPSVAAQFLSAAIQQFTRTHAGISVQIHDVVAEKIIEAVKKEEVDFGIGCRIGMDRELKAIPLFVDRLCAFAPKSHLLARQGSISLKELVTRPLILTGKDSSVREIVERELKREKLPLSIAYETNYMSTAMSLVNAGLGIAVLPESAANAGDSSGIRAVPIGRPLLSRKIEILQKKDRSLSPAAGKLLETIRASVARAASH
jgi:DNA-binding transcriptional LysR family regulator